MNNVLYLNLLIFHLLVQQDNHQFGVRIGRLRIHSNMLSFSTILITNYDEKFKYVTSLTSNRIYTQQVLSIVIIVVQLFMTELILNFIKNKLWRIHFSENRTVCLQPLPINTIYPFLKFMNILVSQVYSTVKSIKTDETTEVIRRKCTKL